MYVEMKNEQYYPAEPVLDAIIIAQNKNLALKFFRGGIMVGMTNLKN